MSTVVDTSVIIDLLRDCPPQWPMPRDLERVPAGSEITRVEVARGLRTAERGPTESNFHQLW